VKNITVGNPSSQNSTTWSAGMPARQFFPQNNRLALKYCASQRPTVSQPASPPENPDDDFPTVTPSCNEREFRIYTNKFEPTESPDDGDDNPPESPAIPLRIYPNKFKTHKSPADRMTRRLEDGSIKLAWREMVGLEARPSIF
jgi:hypothetical protein